MAVGGVWRFRGRTGGDAPGRMRGWQRPNSSEVDSEDNYILDRAFTGAGKNFRSGFSATIRGQGLQVPIRDSEEFGTGMSRRQVQPDFPYRDPDLCSHFQQFQPDRSALRLGHL